ncbi:MAG: hypothetical protein V7607_5811 [Solirubrobacteraceae bacterium]
MTDVPPEAELAFLLTGTLATRDSVRARVADLAGRIDEDAFVSFLRDQRMLLLGGTRLCDLAPRAISQRLHDRLDDARANAHARAMLFAAASRHVTGSLEREDIPAVELKGAALAEELHGDAALRGYTDIDVLVPAERLDDAVAIACRLGWREPTTHERRPALHRWLDHPDGALPVLEIHWRVHWYETRFAEAMLARSRLVHAVRHLEPIDQLAALLLFYARDGFTGLRMAADIGAWWDLHGNAGTARGLEHLVAEHAELAEAWRAALVVVSPLAGLPTSAVPTELHPRSRRTALACRLRNWDLRGDIDQIKANVSLTDGLLSPPGEMGAFVRRHVLVAPFELSRAYDVAPDSRVRVVGAYMRHVAKMSARYGLGLARLTGGRSWSPLPASPARSRAVATYR